jgi:hypothetical protein
MPKKTKESLVMDASSSFHRRRNDQCSALVVDYDKNVRESSQPIGSHRPLFSLAPNSESLEIFCSEFLQPDLRHARHSTADFQEIQIAIPSSWKFTSTSLPRVRIPPPRFDFLGASRFALGRFPSSFQRTSAFKLSSGAGKTALKAQTILRELEFHEQLESCKQAVQVLFKKMRSLSRRTICLIKKLRSLIERSEEWRRAFPGK